MNGVKKVECEGGMSRYEREPSVPVIPIRNIGVIGSRKLPATYAGKIEKIVDYLIYSN